MILQLTPFIMLDGNAKEAIDFYVQSLDAKVVFIQTFGESPDSTESSIPENARDRIAHSVLKSRPNRAYGFRYFSRSTPPHRQSSYYLYNNF